MSSLALLQPSEKIKLLRDCEDELVSSLCNVNVKEFHDKISERCLLSKESQALFTSLDHSRLKPELQLRYLVRLASEEVITKPALRENLLEVLGTIKGVPSSLIDKLHQAMADTNEGLAGSSDAVGGVSAILTGEETEKQDIVLTRENVSLLTEWLATASDKWVEIAISLGLRKHERADCEGKSNIISLSQSIEYWIDNSDATLNKLTDALSSKTVGHKTLSNEVKEKSEELSRPCKKRKIMQKSSQTLKITKISLPCEVADGKSTLLQVQARPRESVSYQWNKDGQPLLKNSCRYSGVHEDILVVKHAFQGSEGEYTCRVSLQDEQETSNPINLAVHFSPAKELLLNSYSALKEVPTSRNDWPPIVANKFVELAIIKSSGRNTSGTVQGNADGFLAEKEKIEYDKVFGEYKSKELIFIEGQPGSGKTTLVHKVIKDWASGKALVNADLTILLTLRLLNIDSENETLAKVFQSFYSNEELTKLAETRDGGGVCFLLDGLDEYRPLNKQKSIITKLLDRKCLRKSMIIVFSRPSAIEQLQKNLITKRIEVFGFSKKHISEYIDNFPFDEGGTSDSSVTRASQLKDFLLHNRSIHDMCYLPIHAAMICFLFQFDKNISLTQTKVYEEFTRLIVQRHLTRHEECKELASLKFLKGVHAEHFKNLCHLAYEMTIKSKQVISSQELQAQLGGSGSLSEESCLGLLTICSTLYQTGIHQNYAFLHLTSQEFLTAYYIANYLDESNQIDLLQKYSHMKRVWRFYISLIDFAKVLNKIDLFVSKYMLDGLYLCHCAFDLQQKIFCDEVLGRIFKLWCINAATPADLLVIEYVIATSSLPLTHLVIGGYNHDDERSTSLLSRLQKKDNRELNYLGFNMLFDNSTDSLCEVIKSATNITVLMLRIQHNCSCNAAKLANQISQCTKLNELQLFYSGTPECIQSLVGSLSFSVPIFSLIFFNLDSQSIQALGTGLINHSNPLRLGVRHSDISKNGMTCLADGLRNFKTLSLDLSYNNINSNGITPLAEGLDTLNLNYLNLSHNKIGPEGGAALAGIKHLTKLQEFNLSHNDIGPEGAAALAGEIKCLTKLQKLNLSHNNVGPEGAVALAGIKHLTTLQELNLSHNNIGPEGVAALVGEIKRLTKLQWLELSHNNIGPEGAAALAGEIKCMTELQWLELSYNNIGFESAAILAGEMKYLTQLWWLNLSYNNIGPDGAAALAGEIKCLTEFWWLDLSHNSFGPNSAAAEIKCFIEMFKLDLYHNSIGPEDAILLAEGIKYCTKLEAHTCTNNNDVAKAKAILAALL